jgi:NAD-dependent SIR2 family protein deacetylase
MTMELQIYLKGRLASIDCGKCCRTIYWHEWTNDDGSDSLKTCRCPECGGTPDLETYWESRSRNYYAGRYSMPGYMDCTDFEYGKNKRNLERELRNLYGS